MKRIVLLVLFVTTTFCANAQLKFGDMLACTRDEVNVRTGPGTNYPVGEVDRNSKANPLNDSDISKIIKKYNIYTEGLELYKLKKATDKEEYCQLNKPLTNYNSEDYFYYYYLGKSQNGNLYIGVFFAGFFGDRYVYKGWVPSQYLKKGCGNCKGGGFVLDEGKICPKCHGRGY